jgi:hypothetical protein
MWNKKWYFKRNISCDVHLLNELIEMDVPWDDAIVVSAGKLRKLWDSLSELHSSLCERRLDRTVLRPALLPIKTAHFSRVSPQVWRHTVKSLSLTEGCIGRLSLSWPAGQICPTYKGSFQVRWDNSIALFLYAVIQLKVYLFRWTSQNAFSRETAVYKWYCVQCCVAATQRTPPTAHSNLFQLFHDSVR